MNKLRDALTKLAEAHKFNSTPLLPTEVYAICFDALEIDEDAERRQFEEDVFARYFASSITFHPDKQFADCTAVSPLEFFKRATDGDYSDESLSAMWYALARGFA
jgi:hypothetical protein